jgi:hypothetical protein
MPKICIIVPANKPIKALTVKSLLDVVAYGKFEYHIVIATEGYTPSEKRNYGIVQSLNHNCDYTFFVDDDMVFPPNIIEVLVGRNKDVIGAMYYFRGLPLEPIFEKLTDEQSFFPVPKEPFQVKGVGAGLFLANNKIFMPMDKPWFDTKVNGLGQSIIGDSYWFGDRVRSAGFTIWCDPTIKTGHIGDYIYG